MVLFWIVICRIWYVVRFVGWIKICVFLKIQWKQHHNLYIKITYNTIMTHRKIRIERSVMFNLGKFYQSNRYASTLRKALLILQIPVKTYMFEGLCVCVRYWFIFDSFGASQIVYRNLWYVESPLLKIICFSTQSVKKQRFDYSI